MSIQLIVYPQSYDGFYNPIAGYTQEYIVDGINFTTINTSTSSLNLPTPTYTNAISNMGIIPINTWYRFSGDGTAVTESSGAITIGAQRGIIQQLSNLSVNTSYSLTIDVGTYASTLEFQQYTGTVLQATYPITSSGVKTISFQAYSTSDTILIYSTATNVINSISVLTSMIQPSGNNTFLGTDGQVICDLYEDEDIPLSLSIDDFKNVAEQVQSYSKAFNLPGTKRNNKIFDNLFEITRADDGIIFNPYVKTQCKLKQDGFIIFEGYLRMIDIQDKQGEISYNVNLYSEVIALADVLGDRTFSQLDFTELEHPYNKQQIKYSWNDAPSTGITYTNPNTSGFRDANDTVKYPFVDWNHQMIIANNPGGTSGPTNGFPQLTSLEQAFRPFIQIKYLIDRIFNQDDFPFSYESTFFDTDDFKKLYMDFNWGSDRYSLEPTVGEFTNTTTVHLSTTTYANYILNDFSQYSSDLNYDGINHRFVAAYNNTQYNISPVIRFNSTGTPSGGMNVRIAHRSSGGALIQEHENQYFTGTVVNYYVSAWTLPIVLNQNDTLQVEWKSDVAGEYQQGLSGNVIVASTGGTLITTNTFLQTLRGELNQWEFLKGIITMFNLVSVADKSDPNHIKIEPYNDMFLENSDSKQWNWTDKVDVEEIKLTPLTNLNKNTSFKFVEDDDDWAFKNYKIQVGGHLYGSQKWEAAISSNGRATILEGTREIIAAPFAATVVKPLMPQFADLIIPSLYSYNPDDGTSEGFDNSPRIMYNNGVKTLQNTITYYIPEQNGLSSENQSDFLQFSHLTDIPTITGDTRDFHFGMCQLISPIGVSVPDNLFNLYWLPYLKDLYDPNTRIMTIKVNLTPGDVSIFRFYDTVIIKNREFRVNKIDYKPNDLATIEFILIP
tara:strand:- start:3461 stop:6139 length:2679 start_codon:yes stop_codon:yes gene_type:complete